MNTSIPMMGRGPDILGAIDSGNMAAARQNQFMRDNALAQLYQDQGAQIAAGDQNALNALARFDPTAAIGVQDTRLGMDAKRQSMQATQQRMDMLNREEARAVEEYKRGLSAQQAEAEAQRIENAVKMGLSVQTPQEWDAMMGSVSPDLVGQFGQREALANRYMSIAEILKGQGGGFRQASPDEAARYGAQGGQFGPDGRFYPINPPNGMSIETGPDGQMRIVQGPGAGNQKPFTEGQSKDNVYTTRAEGALKALEPVADALTSRGEIIAESVPLGLGREMQTDDFQVARNAGDEFLQAILRKDTGAAITAQEQELYGKTYLPQPGDKPAVLAAKKAARARAVEAIRAGMSIEQITATEQALVNAAARVAPVEIDGFKIEAID
jgi:hypothetical protein